MCPLPLVLWLACSCWISSHYEKTKPKKCQYKLIKGISIPCLFQVTFAVFLASNINQIASMRSCLNSDNLWIYRHVNHRPKNFELLELNESSKSKVQVVFQPNSASGRLSLYSNKSCSFKSAKHSHKILNVSFTSKNMFGFLQKCRVLVSSLITQVKKLDFFLVFHLHLYFCWN